MNLKQDVRPVTFLKENVSTLLDQLDETRHPVVITRNGSMRAVIQDVEAFEQTSRAFSILKLTGQGEADVRVGRIRPAEQVFANVRRAIRSNRG